jgi:hypothetical protein
MFTYGAGISSLDDIHTPPPPQPTTTSQPLLSTTHLPSLPPPDQPHQDKKRQEKPTRLADFSELPLPHTSKDTNPDWEVACMVCSSTFGCRRSLLRHAAETGHEPRRPWCSRCRERRRGTMCRTTVEEEKETERRVRTLCTAAEG